MATVDIYICGWMKAGGVGKNYTSLLSESEANVCAQCLSQVTHLTDERSDQTCTLRGGPQGGETYHLSQKLETLF